MALAPLLIHEFVKDKDRARRLVRISVAVTAIASAATSSDRVRSARQERGETASLASLMER